MPIVFVTPGQPTYTAANYSGKCCQWVVPTGVTTATFEVWGGGGGGGQRICGSTSMCCNQGQPGAGGGYAKYTIAVTPGDAYTLCAGSGGQSNSTDYNGYYNGSGNGGCCNGCSGQTSYVTGPAFTTAGVTLCATGGHGGCGDGNFACQAWCGWNNSFGVNCLALGSGWGPGCGFGGQVNATGGGGMVSTGSTMQGATDVHAWGGNGGGPNGGAGGVKVGNGVSYGCYWWYSNGTWAGGFPGGGGVGGGYYTSCGCCYPGAPGGAGLVKVTY